MKSLIAALWDKTMTRKKKSKKPQTKIDYTIVDVNDGQITGIGINSGKYAGILYHYGRVKVSEEDGYAKFSFEYTLLQESPNFTREELQNDEEFRDMMGIILTQIIADIPKDEIEEYFVEENT